MHLKTPEGRKNFLGVCTAEFAELMTRRRIRELSSRWALGSSARKRGEPPLSPSRPVQPWRLPRACKSVVSSFLRLPLGAHCPSRQPRSDLRLRRRGGFLVTGNYAERHRLDEGAGCNAQSPSTATTVAREPWPLTALMLDEPIPNRSATRAMKASLARPFSGGAFTFALGASPSQPTISPLDDPGTTFRLKRPMR